MGSDNSVYELTLEILTQLHKVAKSLDELNNDISKNLLTVLQTQKININQEAEIIRRCVIDFYYQNGFSMYRDFRWGGNCLNDEVEIIEEEKVIEKIGKIYDGFTDSYYDTCLEKTIKKVDELVDEINKLRDL